MRCIPPGIEQMQAHHAHHHHHHHAHLYSINPDTGDLVPPKPSRPPCQPSLHPHGGAPRGPAPTAPEPRAELARIAAAPAARGHGAAPAPQAQEPGRGAEGACGDWARNWDAILDPLGGEALSLVMEVYGWLGWLLGDHQGDEKLALRCRAPPEGREESGGATGGVGSPGGPRKGHPGRVSGGVARQGADVAGFPGGGGSAPPSPTSATARATSRRRCPGPQTSGGAGNGRPQRQWSWAAGNGGWERTSDAGHPPSRPGPPDPERPPPPSPPFTQRGDARRPE